MKYEVKFTSQFKKDLKLAKKQGRDLDKLYEVINKIASGEALEQRFHDHELLGGYKGCRECHIEPDWLLIYEIIGDVFVLMLFRLGSHSDLF
ncbi:MAG: type II toxin-antitoxin system YafQ family toxin [Monoglobales bacterium]